MRKPLFSVIIDTYNYARFLPDAINSVLNQHFTDYEIIVVDDCSTDHTRDVLVSYGDKIIPIMSEQNMGQGAAFNAGFQASRGELICFLDADDVFCKNKLASLAKAAEQYPQAILICHPGHVVNQDLEKTGGMISVENLLGNYRERILRTSDLPLPPTSFLMFRRAFLSKVLPLSPLLTRYGADFSLRMLAGIMGDIVSLVESLTLYRVHGKNSFSSNDFHKFETMRRYLLITERDFYCINSKLAELGIQDRVKLLRHRYHRRDLFISDLIGWGDFLFYTFFADFNHWQERWSYIKHGVHARRYYKKTLHD